MIDPENMDGIAEAGFKLLHESGVFRKQIESERARIYEGDGEEEEIALARRIKEHRRRAGVFESLHLLGEELRSKEKKHESF